MEITEKYTDGEYVEVLLNPMFVERGIQREHWVAAQVRITFAGQSTTDDRILVALADGLVVSRQPKYVRRTP